MIETKDLCCRYGDFVAVDEVSCHIKQGEIVGLLGHNGAGKTTVMKMLTGYLDPASGHITIDGLPMSTKRQAIQRKLGYLPENCPVYPDMTVVEYLNFRADLMAVPADKRPDVIRWALQQTQLEDRALQTIGTLSRGLRQRVGVAQAILHRPDIVILDEPTNGLDPEQIGQMRRLIQQLAQHATVLISTHVLSEVEAVCERVLMMCRGRLVLDAKLKELENQPTLVLQVGGKARALTEQLAAINGIKTVASNDFGRYTLSLEPGNRDVAPKVAELVYQAGLPLYRLTPQVRSLETVFREVNEQARQEVTHA